MLEILAPVLAIVKSVEGSTDPAPCLDDSDNTWMMDDATADELAAEADEFDRYMTGAYAW